MERGKMPGFARESIYSPPGHVLVASLVNPYGYRLHIHVAQYLGSSFYFKRISEFQSADFHTFTAAYFETLLVLAIAAAAWHLGKGRLIHVLLLLSWAHLALFSVRNIPIFAVVSAPGIGLAMRDWLELVGSRWPLDWRGKLAASLAELETGLRVIANGRAGRSWHLAPCLAVLALALSVFHPGRVKTLHADFDRNRFPVGCGNFSLSQRLCALSSALRKLAMGWISDLPALAFGARVRRRSNRFLWSPVR